MKNTRFIFIYLIVSVGLFACGSGSSSKNQVVHKSGRLISHELMAEYTGDILQILGVDADYSAKVYRLIYETKDKDGHYINVSGLLSIPQKGAQAKSPMLLSHHGTIYENKEAPTEDVNNFSSFILSAHIGFITAAPDYIGYGESYGIQHPYLIADLTASTSIDLLRASKTFLKNENILLNNQLFLGGYSQGGSAVFASQKLIEEELAGEFTVTASSAGAGNYAFSDDLLQSSQEILDDYDTFVLSRPHNIGLIFKTMDSIYGLKMLSRIFDEKYVPVVNTIYDGTHNSAYIDSKLTNKASEFLNKGFLEALLSGQEQNLLNTFKKNDLYDWKPRAPTMLYHGRDDNWVKFFHAQKAYDTMRANGATEIQLVECETSNNLPTNHANCFIPYLFKSYDFFEQYATHL